VSLQLQHLLLVKVKSKEPHQLDFTHTYCFNCEAEELYRVSFMPVRDVATIEDPVLRFQYVPGSQIKARDARVVLKVPLAASCAQRLWFSLGGTLTAASCAQRRPRSCRPENNLFILDSKETMPSPMLINIKHEANDLGVDFDVDLYSGLQPPALLGDAIETSASDLEGDDTVPRPPPTNLLASKGMGPEGSEGGTVAAGDVAAELLAAPAVGDVDGTAAKAKAKRQRKAAMEAAVAEEESAGEETSKLTTGAEIDPSDTPDVPAVDLV
jgi:hypothetical protein